MDFLINTDFGKDATAYYNNYISNPLVPFMFTAALLLAVDFFLISGLTNKVEKFSKVVMPLLLLLLFICGIGALITSSNVPDGLKYYLFPDFSKLTFKTISDACVQVMFSIGTGWCLYVTLGANVSREENIKKTAGYICVCDTLIAILVGFVGIPPVVGAGAKMEAGPSLVFIAMTEILSGMPREGYWDFCPLLLCLLRLLQGCLHLLKYLRQWLECLTLFKYH